MSRPIDYEALFEDGRAAGASQVIEYLETKLFYIPDSLLGENDTNRIVYNCIHTWINDCKVKFHLGGK